MKNLLFGFYLLIMISFLAACITIPVGDDVLKISSDGIEFISEDGESEDNENAENESSNQNDESQDGNNDSNDPDEELTESNDVNTDDPVDECEKQDHSEITDNIDIDFYIPECAILTNLKKDNNGISANFTIEGGKWEDISDEYLEFLGDDQAVDERKNVAHKTNDIRATLSNEGKIRATINQKDEYVQLRVRYDHPKK